MLNKIQETWAPKRSICDLNGAVVHLARPLQHNWLFLKKCQQGCQKIHRLSFGQELVGFLRLQIVHDGYSKTPADPTSSILGAIFFFFCQVLTLLWLKSSQCVNNKWKLDREIGPELRSVFFIFFANGCLNFKPCLLDYFIWISSIFGWLILDFRSQLY